MKWNKHLELEGSHAYLSASKYHWLNYEDEKLKDSFRKFMAIQRGTELHDFARRCIELGQRLPKSNKTLNQYVNDAIGFRMKPEQPLYYSENCYGTADAISFSSKFLRIHDLKTGETKAKMEQLMIYAALFCLEYNIDPADIKSELRIYQLDDVAFYNPSAGQIIDVANQIRHADKIIRETKEEYR